MRWVHNRQSSPRAVHGVRAALFVLCLRHCDIGFLKFCHKAVKLTKFLMRYLEDWGISHYVWCMVQNIDKGTFSCWNLYNKISHHSCGSTVHRSIKPCSMKVYYHALVPSRPLLAVLQYLVSPSLLSFGIFCHIAL